VKEYNEDEEEEEASNICQPYPRPPAVARHRNRAHQSA